MVKKKPKPIINVAKLEQVGKALEQAVISIFI